jgi:hypothetical protein
MNPSPDLLIVAAVVALAAGYLLRRALWKRSDGCGGGCGCTKASPAARD